MPSLETALRLFVIGQEFLIAVVFLFGNGNRTARISGSLLLVSTASYLLVSDPVLSEAVSIVLPLVILLAMIVPHCLWSFARAVFEAAWPKWWVSGFFVLVSVLVWLVFVGRDSYGAQWVDLADIVLHVASLIVVLHALLIVARGLPDDLIERRRQFRVYFVVIISIQVGAVLTAELILRHAGPDWLVVLPGWLVLLNVFVIAILTMGLAIPLLRLNPEFFASRPDRGYSNEGQDEDTMSPAETVLKQELLETMDEGTYRQPDLSISALAEQVGHPEHQLRKLINGRLGFRNFSAFLNGYRVREARRILADAEHVRKPVLTIALDLGYGSLGPFNRAFRAATNMTPTEYRRQALSPNHTESE